MAVFRGRRIEVFGQQRQDQPRDLWDNENQAKYDSKLINLWVPVAGVTDQFLVEVKDLYETVDLAGQFFSHPYETVSGIYDLFSGLTVEQLKTVLGEAVEQEVRAFTTPGRKRQYKVSRAVTASVYFLVRIGSGTVGFQFAKATGGFVKRFKTFAGKFTNFEVGEYLSEMNETQRKAFFDDFEKAPEEMIGFFDGGPGRVKAWEALISDDFLRKSPEKLIKVDNYAIDFGKRFEDIADEFKIIPFSQRHGWIAYLEFRTNGRRVNKAGNRSVYYNRFGTNNDVPSRYSNDPRFTNKTDPTNLAYDPATDKFNSKTRQEAMAGLEAESQGLIAHPIARDPSGSAEFIDGNGVHWDVKSPPSKGLNTSKQIADAGKAIKGELTFTKHNVILDTTWMTDTNLNDLRTWLQANLSSADLAKFVEVNVNL